MHLILGLIGLLNGFAGVVGALWLAVLGEWKLIGLGVAAAIIAPSAINLAFLPGHLLLGLPGAALLMKGHKTLASPFIVINQIYTHAVIAIWCIATLLLAEHAAAADSTWPRALFAYGVAIAPLQYLVALDEKNEGGGTWQWLTLLISQLAYVVMGALFLLAGWAVVDASFTFAALMLVSAILATLLSMAAAN